MAGSTVRVISGNFITARPVGIVDGVDFQHSGLVRKVDVAGIQRALDMDALVLHLALWLLAHGRGLQPEHGGSRHLGGHRAQGRQAGVPVRSARHIAPTPSSRQGDDNPIDTELPLAQARNCWRACPPSQQPTDTAFYLQHCVKACQGGVERSHIIPFAVDGALLLEIYVHDGIGTMIVDEKLEELREATADDVGGILQLIEPFEKDGTLVKRDRTEIERDIANYTIIEHDGVIFGCAALYPYPEKRTGRNGRRHRLAAKPGHGRRRKAAQAHRAARAPWGWKHLRAHHAHHALVHQARLRAGGPRVAARSAQAQVQLGPAQPGAGAQTLIAKTAFKRLYQQALAAIFSIANALALP
jgi:hypothetical protein